jgi:hypothetical protein
MIFVPYSFVGLLIIGWGIYTFETGRFKDAVLGYSEREFVGWVIIACGIYVALVLPLLDMYPIIGWRSRSKRDAAKQNKKSSERNGRRRRRKKRMKKRNRK